MKDRVPTGTRVVHNADQDGVVLDSSFSRGGTQKAAKRFFQRLLKDL